ncbi:hypothetical protein [Fodinibius sp.]|uniref:hypothetical protein n=1 Tax=Fodinibius sp. TaxID=1872440 RepID=UPI0035630570
MDFCKNQIKAPFYSHHHFIPSWFLARYREIGTESAVDLADTIKDPILSQSYFPGSGIQKNKFPGRKKRENEGVFNKAITGMPSLPSEKPAQQRF